MGDSIWTFEAMDSLFFRDGKPMNAAESTWIESVFPPSGQTLQGAVRAAVLQYLGADIKAFQEGKPCLRDGSSLKEELGDHQTIGQLNLTGPFVCENGQPLFPAPFDVVRNEFGNHELLKPAPSPMESDLGPVRYPVASDMGFKPLAGSYVSAEMLRHFLNGKLEYVKPGCFSPLYAGEGGGGAPLTDREPKVGLARDNASRINEEGMLFAIAPVRPRKGVSLALKISGLKSSYYPDEPFLQRLGGEGKMARIKTHGVLSVPKPGSLTVDNGRIRFKIVLTTPGRMPQDGWLPADFQKYQTSDYQVWRGREAGCSFDIISACLGKSLKIGGWDMAAKQSRPLINYVPAGSVYFCEANADQKEAILGLHNKKTGTCTQYGCGHMMIGTW
ncbi:MAG: hypothetical protein OEM02_10210 [Desulfobulbaceae bacterium]|nr:hypothetical protein [Desulfobulbaceae bacterium]